MPATVTVTITKGELKSKQFNYSQKEILIVGRDNDCAVFFPEKTVSRYHCLIDIAPPSIMVRDIGSKNGTYLNGKLIGKRPKDMPIEEARKQRSKEFYVKSGDRLGLGRDCEITINVSMPQCCSNCSCEIESVAHKDPAELPLCSDCRNAQKRGTSREIKCEICGDSLRDDEKRLRICASCFKTPEKAVNYLLKRARGGDSALQGMANFRIINKIGHGGMGEVFRVADADGRYYALKIMLPQAAVSDVDRKAFVREAQMQVQLDHPNVVRAYHFGEMNNLYYLLMELCNGGSVYDLIRKNGEKLSLEQATYIILQTLDGLIYAHSAEIIATNRHGKAGNVIGIVHRDIKPSNIFLSDSTNEPTVKVADFGLAKPFEIAGLSGHTIGKNARAGTPQFMPRQQISNYRYARPDVDVWAAAATYYYMVTGFYPKDEWDERAALETAAIPIRQRDSNIPERLAAVIDKALIEESNIGIQSAAELKEQIMRAL